MSSRRNILDDTDEEYGIDDASERSYAGSSPDEEMSDITFERDDDAQRDIAIENRRIAKRLFHSDSEESDEEPVNENPMPKRKEVRFSQVRVESQDDIDDEVRPWEFKEVIRREFQQKLPNNYQIKNWKRPTVAMTDSIIELLDINFRSAQESVFEKYRTDLERLMNRNEREIKQVYLQKEDVMNDIIAKIKQKLRKSKFPARLADHDLDIEYIFAKRKFIQNRYTQELTNAEMIEIELVKEEKELQDAKDLLVNLRRSNHKMLKERLIQNDLHPSLNKAITNAYGLLDNNDEVSSNNTEMHSKEIKELNMNINTNNTNILHKNLSSNIELETVSLYLPSLTDYKDTKQELYKNIEQFLDKTHSKEIGNLMK
ncbi:hypothetical protein Kpol_2002p87 [Vanderwaltozyma polyspora DSM 70294]|uniref:Uncharacterized protein n=1 Tax=Vanderwaltozyma polyspora (strain ATCC 22028 / DSM 70294 / BCRC 21397 / CBS 2163 / NBRC 10782 / NRRL Y-8283 / UCD 57-17) TaxID=436907 RepID=A7TFK2_VANPO|nr:uncharacterized protein Kpol_2002p87 [Vanderwaltozyma polyspora DSM 70294]EDO19016.1 hypothetical protein Kpol_2002p87 [Vanderwaltozyma polyspora DSM 70294]